MDATVDVALAEKTNRFRDKRVLIVEAATALIIRDGVKGMTLADVGKEVGLNTTSITYYFKRKEQLAEACFNHSLDRIEELVSRAEREDTPRARVFVYIKENFDVLERAYRGTDRRIIVLSGILSTEEPTRTALTRRYQAIFRRIRGFWGAFHNEEEKLRSTARAHVLQEAILWLPNWLSGYSVADFDRVRARLFEVFDKGIALREADWSPELLDFGGEEESSERNFLLAATRLINERGYRGASVVRISSQLNVTKGSFYHHLDAKDELVLQCFQKSFSTLSLAQSKAHAAGGSFWQRLSSIVATLLDVQFSERGPLLRTTALQALPSEIRKNIVDKFNQIATHFAGIMIDAITEGSVRPVDPLVAAQALMAMLNAAYELRNWASRQDQSIAIARYASTLMYGIFDAVPASNE
jgi:AcrR family transcriptional regulator